MKRYSAAGILSLTFAVLVAACSDSPAPTGPAADEGPVHISMSGAPQGSAPDRAALTRAIPGFGGIFFDGDGVLTVNLVDPGQRGRAEQALAAFAQLHGTAPSRIRVNQARYPYQDLDRWFNRLWPEAFEVGRGGVVFADLNETRNRVVIGVHDPSVMAPIRALAARLGIPEDAVVVEAAEPIRPMVTLRQLAPSIMGGYQIHFGNYLCTLGFNALSGSAESFITNSHCTNKQGEMTGTLYYQPTSSVSPTAIGIEVDDPEYWKGDGCPQGSRCRYSDAARALRQSDRTFSRGYIAKTTGPNNGSLEVAGSFRITGTYDQAGLDKNCVVEGTSLSKVGRTTGWTAGTVTNSCFHTGVLGSNIVQLYQVRVSANVDSGDSGSPVFRFPGTTDDVTLYGILWGGGSSSFVFSPITNVRHELGGMTVTAGGEPAPPATGSVSGTVTDAGSGAGISGATVAIDGTGLSTTTAGNGSYLIDNVAAGSHNVTASATGYVAATKPASITAGEVTTVDFALTPATGEPDPPPTGGTVTVDRITYGWHGGPQRNRHLTVTVWVEDGEGVAVGGATVSIRLDNTDTGGSWTATGTTGTGGSVAFTMNNAPNGCYTTTVTNLSAAGLEWDGSTPTNEGCK
jgi:hypothetical protein